MRSRWKAWILISGAITPNDPTGANSDAARLLLSPIVRLAGGNPYNETSKYSSRANVVECSGLDPAAGGVDYIAVVPAAAVAAGCARA